MAAAEFATFSVWLARISVFCMFGGLLQYAGNFFPTSKVQAERSLLVSVVATFIFSVAWLVMPADSYVLQGTLIVLSAGFYGWILGQIQQRLLFVLMGILSLSMAVAKLTFIFTPGTFVNAIDRFSYAVLICYFSSLFIVYLFSRKREFEVQSSPTGLVEHNSLTLWMAPVILSMAGAIIPQMDILVLEKWQSAEVFQDFVRASLFYKGIYFLMFIFAQWMLPQQVSKSSSAAQKGILTYKFGVIAVLGTMAVTLVSPLVLEYILKWDSFPPTEMIFYSCLSMSLLTWIFLLIQESCGRGVLKAAGGALVGILTLLGLQLILKLEVAQYFQLAIVCYSVMIFGMIRTISGNAVSSR